MHSAETEKRTNAIDRWCNKPRQYMVPLDSISDVMNRRPAQWLVKGLVPSFGMTVIFGASNSGKTFLTMDLAMSLASGATQWFGHRCTTSGVIYLALEGSLSIRLTAWSKGHVEARIHDATIAIYSGPLNLFDCTSERVSEIAADLLAQCITVGWRPGLVIVDTLVRAAPGADENSVKDISRVIENLTALGTQLEACVLVIHHSGKNQNAGMRGSSALLGAADQVLEIREEQHERVLRVFKARDANKDIEVAFDLQVIDVGTDEDGDPITSCVVVPSMTHGAPKRTPPPKPGGSNQKLVFKALLDGLATHGRPGVAPAPSDRPSISMDELVELASGVLSCEPRRAPERIRTAISGMAASGAICLREQRIWLPS